jgi:hypothetical protein
LKAAFIAFALATLLWSAYSWLQYDLIVNSDCSYMQTPECKAILELKPQVVFWRWLAGELAGLSVLIWFWKR